MSLDQKPKLLSPTDNSLSASSAILGKLPSPEAKLPRTTIKFSHRAGDQRQIAKGDPANHKQIKGPATAPTVPSHGSTNPEKDTEMNSTDTTTGRAAAPVLTICDAQLRGLTRRSLLKQSQAVLMVASIPATAVVIATPAVAAPSENPDLLAAYERFLAARAKVAAAEDALEWLVDEWRHLWPLAPEEILGGANADRGSGGPWGDTAERDIAGRYVYRDTSNLTRRLTRKMREETPRTCFGVESTAMLREVIEGWERPRRGRTAAALARHVAYQQKVLAEHRQKLRLSEEYYATTLRLRKASGVENVKLRIVAARKNLKTICEDISHAEVRTHIGLRIKAEALNADASLDVFRGKGILGEMVRLIDDALDVIGRASL